VIKDKVSELDGVVAPSNNDAVKKNLKISIHKIIVAIILNFLIYNLLELFKQIININAVKIVINK